MPNVIRVSALDVIDDLKGTDRAVDIFVTVPEGDVVFQMPLEEFKVPERVAKVNV